MTYLRMGDESYYGLNGLRVNYEAAEGSYELAVENGEGPRAELMLALCNDRLYSDQEKQIMRLLKEAEKGGDEYAKKWLETGGRAEPPVLWGVKTADVITETPPDSSVEELCKRAQDYLGAYDKADENGRPQEAKLNLIKARYYADLAAEEEGKTADIFDAPIFGTESEQLRERAERLLWQYEDDGDEPDDEAAANALRHNGLAEDEPEADGEDDYDEEQQFTFAEEYIRDGQPEEAFEIYYQMASVRGSAAGAFHLAVAYYESVGTKQNYRDALYWLDVSAARGYEAAVIAIEDMPDGIKADAAYSLSSQFYRGEDGALQDYAEAARWTKMAVEAGDVFAPRILAAMYINGEGVPQDDEKAAELYKLGIERGDTEGTELLRDLEIMMKQKRARAFFGAEEWGNAFPILQELAQMGIGGSMLMLAHLYAHGRGVPQDRSQAQYWLKCATQSADGEIAKAAAEQLKTLEKLEADKKASEILDQAEKLINEGLYTKAIPLLHEGLEMAVEPLYKGFAEYKLAYLYGNGLGVSKDIEQAEYWTRRAAVHGDKDAIDTLDYHDFLDEVYGKNK